MYKTCSTKSKLPRIAQLEPSHNQFQTQTWGKCNHLQPDLLLLQQRMELPRTQSQLGSTRHSNCKKLHGCMTHSPLISGVPKNYANYQGMPPCCCQCHQRVWSLFTVIKKMAGRSLHADGVSCWLLLQCL